MPIFSYQGRDSQGQPKTGKIDAGTASTAARELRERGIVLTSLTLQGGMSYKEGLERILNRVKGRDIVTFSRQFATMIEAGLPLVEAINVLRDQTTNPYFKRVIQQIVLDVEGGSRLSIAMEQYPHIFNDFYVALIRTGETSGRLSEVMKYLAEQVERDEAIKSEIRGAVTYPAFIFAAMIGMGMYLFIAVIPKITEILLDSGVELPFQTRMMIFISGFLSKYWWAVVIGIIAVVSFLSYYIRRTLTGRTQWDALKINLPIFGKFFQQLYMARFGRSLATLLNGGLPIVQAIIIVGDVVNNIIYKNILLESANRVKNGDSMTSAFKGRKEFPTLVTQLANVGEKTGRLSDVLSKMSDFYEENVARAIKNMVKLIEPALILVIGAAIGFVVLSVIKPIYDISSAM